MAAFLEHLTALRDLLFPLECLACGASGRYCCPACLVKVPLLGRELPLEGLDRAYAVAPYGHPLVRRMVRDLKFLHRTAAMDAIGGLADRWALMHAAAIPIHGAVLCPVPLHPARARERGYDQAALIAARFAKALSAEYVEALIRRRKTPSQTKAVDRFRNVRHAFGIRETSAIVGRTCLLVDDVITTGATMRACAEALRAGGARRVIGLALASGFTKGEKSPTV